MDKINAVLNRFPQNAYDGENINIKSVLYNVIKAIVDELNITMNNIDRVDKMINIDSVLPDDIYNRFGALLNIKQNPNETDEEYRNRLKVSITSLSGGTIEAIKYAIANGLGITGDQEAMDRIQIYDAWKYPGDADVVKEYGYIVCEVDLNHNEFSESTENIIIKSINEVKASGVSVQFIYRNFRIVYYTELEDITYGSLSTIVYNKVGE